MKRRLRNNEYFQDLILEYVKSLTGFTLSDLIKDFEGGLIRIFPDLKSKNYFDDEEIVSLLTALEEWHRDVSESFTEPQSVTKCI